MCGQLLPTLWYTLQRVLLGPPVALVTIPLACSAAVAVPLINANDFPSQFGPVLDF